MRPALNNRKTRSAADRSKTFKDSFDNMVTAEQERIMEVSTSRPAPRNQKPHAALNAFSMEEEQEAEVPLEAIRQVDADKMSILVSQLLAKNVLSPNIQKINAKNAFDVPMILLTQTQAFSEVSSDNSWKRLSSTLESNNKIYGYRVDAAHNYTYRVLELFTRRQKVEERDQDGDRRDRNELNTSISPFLCEDFDDCYAKYLEKNLKNINIQHLESFFNVNPVLEKTKRIFDQQGLGSLLLNSLDISLDLSLRISLIQQTNIHEISTKAQENMVLCELECGKPPQTSNIFKIIENTCYLNNLIERNEDFYLVKRQTDQIEALWHDLEAEFACKRERRSVKFEDGLRFPIQVEPENQQLLNQNCPAPSANHQDPQRPQSPNLHQVSNFTNNESKFQLSTNAFLLTPQDMLETNYDPQFNYSQMGLNITPSNNSHLSQEVSKANLMDESQNHIQISSYIKMNKKWFSNDLVLQQLTEVDEAEAGEKGDLVEKWKNQQKKRKPREKKPVVEFFIDFLDASDGVRVGRKHEVLNINKKEKAQFKRLLKNLKIPTYKDTNCVKDCKVNFNVKYLLSRYEEIKKDCHITEIGQGEDQRMEVEVDDRIVIDLQAEEERWAAKRNASIREAKEFIKAQIDTSMEEEVSFASLYKNFQENDSLVSPALCFLTVLHLTNEHNYTLSQREGQYNFLIRRQ